MGKLFGLAPVFIGSAIRTNAKFNFENGKLFSRGLFTLYRCWSGLWVTGFKKRMMNGNRFHVSQIISRFFWKIIVGTIKVRVLGTYLVIRTLTQSFPIHNVPTSNIKNILIYLLYYYFSLFACFFSVTVSLLVKRVGNWIECAYSTRRLRRFFKQLKIRRFFISYRQRIKNN